MTGDASSPHVLDELLREHNAQLAVSGVSLRLERRGKKLALRGPLPCRRGGGAVLVQRISLGIAADHNGLEQARAALRRVVQQLQQQTFSWSQWGEASVRSPKAAAVVQVADAAAALDRFERDFFADPRRRRNAAGTRTTWTSAYRPYLRRLRQLAAEHAQPLNTALLEAVLESYPLASRGRQQCGTALAALARAEAITLPADWADRAGGYGLHAAQFRQLPSDAQILNWIERIPNPGWRLAYGLMATYGLRNP